MFVASFAAEEEDDGVVRRWKIRPLSRRSRAGRSSFGKSTWRVKKMWRMLDDGSANDLRGLRLSELVVSLDIVVRRCVIRLRFECSIDESRQVDASFGIAAFFHDHAQSDVFTFS